MAVGVETQPRTDAETMTEERPSLHIKGEREAGEIFNISLELMKSLTGPRFVNKNSDVQRPEYKHAKGNVRS